MTRVVLLLATLLTACRHEPPPLPPPEGYPGELVSTDALGPGFLARQRVVARYGDQEHSFEAVLQLTAEGLTMIALTPYGSKAFVLTQRGVEVELTALVDRELPFPPRYILLDIHRALFMKLPESPGDGEHTGERAGERVTEIWKDERLSSRSFVRLDGQPPGVIEVRFPGGVASGEVPSTIELDNGWFGYELRIRTLSSRPLP